MFFGGSQAAGPRGSREARRDDGALRRVREAHPGPLPTKRAGPRVARRVRAVLRVQLQPHREVLLQGRQTLLQN